MGTVAKTMENIKKCICVKCPSYTWECKLKEEPRNLVEIAEHHKDMSVVEHFEGLFCAYGKSKCIKEKKGCICGECPVYKENALTDGYFCLK